MKSTAATLSSLIDQHLPALNNIPQEKWTIKPSPEKWSRKEILGHLIDSAQSNIRRFVVAQYDDTPHIVYKQDFWVSTVNYQQWNTGDIINLWYLLNKQAARILENMSDTASQRNCRTGEVHTIEWLANDYVKHLQHHLHQVLDLEPVAYP